MAQAKITVKVFAPLLTDFDVHLRALHLKRDAFLDNVLRLELPNLERDLQGKRLSPKARQHIARKLKRMGTVQVNITINTATADQLRNVVGQANIVRDAFINRIIYLLRASDRFLDYLGLPHTTEGLPLGEISSIPVSPIGAIAIAHADPLGILRRAVHKQIGTGLYSLELPDEFTAFACYLDDVKLAEIPAFARRQPQSDQFDQSANELEALEDKAFRTTSDL